jgi:putative peptidoglycan lipid II flippase
MQQLYVMMLPALLGMAVAQINITASRIFATHLGEGFVVCLLMSNRLVQLPLAIVAGAFSTAILPQISQLWIEDRKNDLCNLVRFAFRLIFIVFVPATIVLCVLGLPIIELIFKRGKWDTQASNLTYQALIYYALGLVVWGMMRILTPIFYADRNVRTPVLIGAVSMVINILLNVLVIMIEPLRSTLGHGGLALANTLSVLVNAILLLWILQRKGLVIWDRMLSLTAIKTSVAASIMGLFSWFLWDILSEEALAKSTIAEGGLLMGTLVVSGMIYVGVALLLRVPDIQEVLLILLRYKKRGR